MTVATLSVAVFMAAFWMAGIVPLARRSVAVVLEALAALRDPAASDEVREAKMRRGSLALLAAFLQIAARSAAVLAAALLPIYLADWAGFVPHARVFDLLARVDVIAGFTGAALVAWLVVARLSRRR